MVGSDADTWEHERARLHHDVFHHQFYQFIKAYEDDLIALLTSTASPSPTIGRVLAGWPHIAERLAVLFDRATGEAIADTEILLARLSMASTTRSDFSSELAVEVRSKAEAIISSRAAENQARIRLALAEPKRLLAELNLGVTAIDTPQIALPKSVAAERARSVLDLCRRFSDAVSAIPGKLRG